jgi:hypothetical protein
LPASTPQPPTEEPPAIEEDEEEEEEGEEDDLTGIILEIGLVSITATSAFCLLFSSSVILSKSLLSLLELLTSTESSDFLFELTASWPE